MFGLSLRAHSKVHKVQGSQVVAVILSLKDDDNDGICSGDADKFNNTVEECDDVFDECCEDVS